LGAVETLPGNKCTGVEPRVWQGAMTRTLVLGGAVSGQGAARLARRLGHQVMVYDRDLARLEALIQEGFAIVDGNWQPELLDGIELAVASPGFPEWSAPVRDALTRGTRLVSELEFAASQLRAPLVAVTGTNGKTTVSSMIMDMCIRSGLKAVAAGNIGTALSEVVGEAWDVVVAEASSFQLRFTQTLHPRTAVLLNLAPDHLDWHGSFEAYAAAKCLIFANQQPHDLLVFDADDAEATRRVGHARSRRLGASGRQRVGGGPGPQQGRLVWDREVAVDLKALPDSDPSFLVDLAAAGAAALEMGASGNGVIASAINFKGTPHRRQLIGRWKQVAWVNDSKATNPHAAVAAAAAFPSVVLIAGGRNKGLDLAPLLAVAGVRRLVAIGEAAAELARLDPQVRIAASMEEAVTLAAALAQPGDTVLLAPACASFDMFDSYAARGDAFAAAVRRLHGET